MELFIIFLLILLNGLFAMSEIALVSSRKFKLENDARRGNLKAREALRMAEHPSNFLSTVQIGITLIGILTGLYSGETIALQFTTYLQQWSWMQPYANEVAYVSVVAFVTFFSILLGELIPKRLGMIFPEPIAKVLAFPMSFLSRLAFPLVFLLSKSNDLLIRLLGIRSHEAAAMSEEEIISMVEESAKTGEITSTEKDILNRVFYLGDSKVSDIMTYRRDIVYLNVTEDLASIRVKVQEYKHSTYPVIDKNIDDVVGLVSIKSLFVGCADGQTPLMTDLVQTPYFIYENTPIYKLLEFFKTNKTHISLVVNEHGETQGIVSMNDLMNAMVGDVYDQHEESLSVFEREDGSWLIDSDIALYDFCQYFDLPIDDIKAERSLPGIFINRLNKLPQLGDKVDLYGYVLEIIDMDGHQIDKILIRRK